MHRRGFLGSLAAAAGMRGAVFASSIRSAPYYVDAQGVDEHGGDLELRRSWSGDRCRSSLTNKGTKAARVHEVRLFAIRHHFPPETGLYGESFQMLSQTGGTLAKPVDFGYSEKNHYKIPQPADATVVTGLLALTPPNQGPSVLAWTSCRRFNGRFFLRPGSIQCVLDTEGLVLAPGETWELEEFTHLTGPALPELLDTLARYINRNHPPLAFPAPPTGWCSWYCFGPRVTAANVRENLAVIGKEIPQLRYIQIDDGYQPAMGDWLDTGQAFGGNVQGVLKEIRERGFEPAIWVAPFIAEAGSKVFQAHPEWFMKDAEGKPLPANKVTFQGWRRGPWYALDGTHPEAQAHFESLFRTMRQQWGVTYFKLDANFWGAMHGGRLHDPKATRIEAYRRGMQAIRKGTDDGFILGCNHPIWASFGLIHGSRSSADINRRWGTFEKIARQNLSRNWQNGRLWWNDPDAVVLTGTLPEEEYRFHATMAWASGGMILSGDDLTAIPPDRLKMLRALLPGVKRAAKFTDSSLRLGVTQLPDGATAYALLNFTDVPQTYSVKLNGRYRVSEVWTGEDLGVRSGKLEMKDLPPHSGRVLIAKKA